MKVKGLRWWVIALIALATVINYIDRQALVVLWPSISEDLYPDKTMTERKEIYALISVVFMFSYAFGQSIFGKIFDKLGTRIGFVLSIGFWSISTALHALASGVLSFAFFRSILGISEAGNWPGAAKGNAEWFPATERAFAQGLFNSGAARRNCCYTNNCFFNSILQLANDFYYHRACRFALVGSLVNYSKSSTKKTPLVN